MSKHTPGPWIFDGFQRIRAQNGPQDGSADLAHVYSTFRADRFAESNMANARLIAAAPEMLEALRFAACEIYGRRVNVADTGPCSCRRCAAISKAEGREA